MRTYTHNNNNAINEEWTAHLDLENTEFMPVSFVDNKHLFKEEVFPLGNRMIRSTSKKEILSGSVITSRGKEAPLMTATCTRTGADGSVRPDYAYVAEELNKVFAVGNRYSTDGLGNRYMRTFETTELVNREPGESSRWGAYNMHPYKYDDRHSNVTLGPSKVVLNYTDMAILIRDAMGNTRVYLPLVTPRDHPYKDCVVLSEHFDLDSPGENFDLDRSYKAKAQEYQAWASSSRHAAYMADVYTLADSVWANRYKIEGLERVIGIGVSINGVSVIGKKELDYIRAGSGLFVDDFNIVMQTPAIQSRYENPIYVKSFLEDVPQFSEFSYDYFINDPNDALADRFIPVMGECIKVVRVIDHSLEPGFYYEVMNTDGLKVRRFMPLADVLKCKWLKRSQEEALEGGTVDSMAKRREEKEKESYELLKRKLEIEEIERKHEREREKWARSMAEEKAKFKHLTYLNAVKERSASDNDVFNVLGNVFKGFTIILSGIASILLGILKLKTP